MKPKNLATILLASTLLTGCALTASQPQPTRYELTPEIHSGTATTTHRGILRVDTPQIATDLDSDHIQLRQTDGTVSFIANAAWNQPPNLMLAPLLIAALDGSHAFSAVVDDRAATNSDLELQPTLEEFTLTDVPVSGNATTGTAHVDITLRLDLIRPSDNKLLLSQRANATAPVTSIRMAAIIPAFNQALAQILDQTTAIVTATKHPAHKNPR